MQRASFKYIKSVFGPAELLRLRDNDLRRFGMERGSIPFGSGLLALAFSSTATAEELIASNAALSMTLVTRMNNTTIVWLRPRNFLPANTALRGVQIITEGLIPIYANPAFQLPRSIYRAGLPVEIDLNDLIFNDADLDDFFSNWLIQERFGPALIRVSSGRFELNPIYWAGRISRATGLRYDTTKEQFVSCMDGGSSYIVVESRIIPELVLALLQHAAQVLLKIPPREMRPKRIGSVIEAIKMFCTVSDTTGAKVPNRIRKPLLRDCRAYAPAS